MSTIPLFPPLRNPNDLGRGLLVIGLTWTFTGLAIITTLLRMYVRRRLLKQLAPEDWLMFFVMVSQVINQSFITVSFPYGLGKHIYDFSSAQDIITMTKWQWFAVPPGLVSGILARIAICTLLVRLFGVHAWFKYYAIKVTACGVVFNFVIPILLFVLYRLVETFYALDDLTFVLFSIFLVSKLQMSFRRRLELILLLALSLFVTALFILKAVLAFVEAGGSNTTYTVALTLLWDSLEQAVVIFIGNLVPLRAIMKLDYLLLTSFASAMISLLGGSRRDTTEPSALPENHGHHGYHDIEMDTHVLGSKSNMWHQVKGNGSF
ncbi:hypothetical protein F5Y10DRAFT_286860 [Nemania abortiva]|nr:hypothetical protein F5Y10DRAFT_286860 [Nemania abortiva]